jgi:signal transduction histidine kinase
VLRIVQESLANIRKHAGARRVDVTLDQGETQLRLVIEDDGTGFTPGELGRSEMPRFGLSTMRERAGNLGGTFLLESSPGAGTRVTVELPTQPPKL